MFNFPSFRQEHLVALGVASQTDNQVRPYILPAM